MFTWVGRGWLIRGLNEMRFVVISLLLSFDQCLTHSLGHIFSIVGCSIKFLPSVVVFFFFFLSVRGTVRRKERCEVIHIAHSLGREYSLEPGFVETVAWFLYEHSYSRPQREGLHLVASTTLGIWSVCCHVSGMPGFCGDPHSFPSFR